jgi:hypothetical protein
MEFEVAVCVVVAVEVGVAAGESGEVGGRFLPHPDIQAAEIAAMNRTAYRFIFISFLQTIMRNPSFFVISRGCLSKEHAARVFETEPPQIIEK